MLLDATFAGQPTTWGVTAGCVLPVAPLPPLVPLMPVGPDVAALAAPLASAMPSTASTTGQAFRKLRTPLTITVCRLARKRGRTSGLNRMGL
jgi:hypothetical protein